MGDSPIVVYILHGLADRFFFFIARDVPQLAVVPKAAVVVLHRPRRRGGYTLPKIDSLKSFQACFRVIPNSNGSPSCKTFLFACRGQIGTPDRALLRHADQAVNKVRNPILLEQGAWVRRSKVSQRENVL